MFKIYQKIEYFLLRIIEKLENQKITLTAWLVSFFAIVYLRIFLEAFSTRFNYFNLPQYPFFLFHSPAFFLVVALFNILLLYFLTKEKIEKISKIALFAFLIILLPPIIDLIATQGKGGIMMRYPGFPESAGIFEILRSFLRGILYGPSSGILFFGQESFLLKMNFGLRIEGVIVLLGILWYIFLKTKSILKVFLGFLGIRFIFFPLSIFPLSFYKFSSSLNPSFDKHFVLFSLYFILIFLLAGFWFYIYNKEKFLAFFKNLRPTRVLNNMALLGFGLYLAKVPIFSPFSLNFSDWLLITMAVLSLFLYWLSGIGYDDLSDEEIDRISNPSRPLPQGKFTREEFRTINNVLRIAAFITAFAVGYGFFIFILLRNFVAYLYSTPPFRLKRFLGLATFIRTLAFVFTIYGGFLLKSTNTIFDFPQKLALFVLVAFTLGITVKDIKDYEGDKVGGISTIPVIFGLEKGKKIIGALVFTAFILCPLFFFDYFKILILPALFAGTLSFWLINKKRFNEKLRYTFLFLIYFSYGLFFALAVF